MSSALRVTALLLVVPLWFGQATAAEPASTEAQEHHDRATKLYDTQQYVEAAIEYQRAYELGSNPNDLYNLGQSYRLAGQTDKALGSYRAFLRRAPSAPVAEHVRKLIVELEAKLADERQALARAAQEAAARSEAERLAAERVAREPSPGERPTVSPISPIEPRRRGGRPMTIAGFTLFAVGLGVAAGGGALLGLAKRDDDRIRGLGPTDVYDPSLVRRRDTEQQAAIGMFAAGGAVAVTGLVVGIVGSRRWKSERVRVDATGVRVLF